MAEREKMMQAGSNLDDNLMRIDEDLQIMERHADQMVESEDDLIESMRRRVREYKDANLHSIPKPRKHMR